MNWSIGQLVNWLIGGERLMKHKSVAHSADEILITHKKTLHYQQITKELTKIRPIKVKEKNLGYFFYRKNKIVLFYKK